MGVDPPPVGQLAAGAVVPGPVAPRPELDACRPLPPQRLVRRQRRDHLGRRGARPEQHAKGHRVLERLVHPLSQVRQHRVRRVAEQREPPAAPPGQRRPVVHSPLEPGAAWAADRLDHRADHRIPAREVRGERDGVTGGRPRLAHRRPRRNEPHVVEELPCPHREHQEVLALADPHPHRPGRVPRQPRHQPPVGHHPGEHRLRRRHHETLQHRVNAVRPDHHVRLSGGAVSEAHRRPVRVLREPCAPVPCPHHVGRQFRREHREQVGTVDAYVPRPGELMRLM